ncbi:phosphatidylinositol 3 and 4-kinase-domain-containing protein [Melampsora americana]|nr:phosphatidylinositol 3 and 4-kinase-domain-containing protein [Melampsora americana]
MIEPTQSQSSSIAIPSNPITKPVDLSNLESLLHQWKSTLSGKFPHLHHHHHHHHHRKDSFYQSLSHLQSEEPFKRKKTRRARRSLKTRLRHLQANRPVPAFQTVFSPTITFSLIPLAPTRTLDHESPVTLDQFLQIVKEVRKSISDPIKPLLPKLNLCGSSGSYFCKAIVDGNPEVVGIFKPKDEEPYGAMNPKWTKWFHRVLLAPLIGGFGRSCLIPNLSYLSEAAASLLDRRLEAYIVPRTEVVHISSPTFFYSWLDRQAAARKSKPRPLPQKPGSFQLFCTGFENASTVLRTHPWPGRPLGDTLDPHNRRRRPRKNFSLYRLLCGQRSDAMDSDDDDSDSGEVDEADKCSPVSHSSNWCWTQELMDDFRHEMEKLVILDYLMRNTDRGLDNFMIKVCNANCHSSRSRKVSGATVATTSSQIDGDNINPDDLSHRPHCHVAAIDNSLAFPHHHPNGLRDYSYGWLFLPVSLIGQPFSASTRAHYLRLLTDPMWWAETIYELRELFSTDPDFNVAMFERQMALLKGQGWNVVESLRHADEGPLELCRRKKALVWDEAIELPEHQATSVQPLPIPAPKSGPEPTRTSTAPAGPMRPMVPTLSRSWSSRTANSISQKPPRPISLAVRRGNGSEEIDAARGVDVMKQMDAMQAWEEEEEQEEGGGLGSPTTFTSLEGNYGTFSISGGEEVEGLEEEEAEETEAEAEEGVNENGIEERRRLIRLKNDEKKMRIGFNERVQFVKAQPVFKNC